MTEIKVTGERDFGTGAQRDPNEDKGRFDLLSPFALYRLARHTQRGAKVRGERNWENGMPLSAVLDSALRHINKYILNLLIDSPQDEDHLAAAMWNLMVAIHMEEGVEHGLYPSSLLDILPTGGQDANRMFEEAYERVMFNNQKEESE